VSGRRGANERVKITDLPQGLLMVMVIVQAVIGATVGMVITQVIQKIFLAGYAMATAQKEFENKGNHCG
jgi:hypothetical protein